MITIEHLSKAYKKRRKFRGKQEYIQAVDDISLTINDGEIVGFIGKNGAGKTTVLKMLSGLIISDQGTVTIDGLDVVKNSHELKSRVGAIAGEYARAFYWRLSGRQNLQLFAGLKGIYHAKERINELLELFELSDFADEKTMKYSTGMKHKLALCMILLNDPPILFLDEPLTGIDPSTAFRIKNVIKTLLKNKTILWTSHNLYEIEELCDRIVLIHKGKIIFTGTPDKLRKKYTQYTKILVQSDKPEAFMEHMDNCTRNKDIVELQVTNVKVALKLINTLASTYDISIESIQTLKKSLEDIFMEVTQ